MTPFSWSRGGREILYFLKAAIFKLRPAPLLITAYLCNARYSTLCELNSDLA